jgi:hypothetical protein
MLQVDHFQPRKPRKPHPHGFDVEAASNKLTACTICNSIKGKRQFDDLEDARDYISRIRKVRFDWVEHCIEKGLPEREFKGTARMRAAIADYETAKAERLTSDATSA